MKDKMICPFCGGEVHIVVCDDDANIHREKGYEEDPWNGLGYVLIHKQEDVPNNIYCPIATYADEDFIGGLIYDTREEAVKIWGNNEIARLTAENERLRAENGKIDEYRCVIDDISEQCKELEAENAKLHARLDKAVILPRIIHPNPNEWHIQYEYKSGIITSDIRRSEYAAEARLAELKGGEGK